MKNKKKTLMLLILIVIFLTATTVGYRYLSSTVTPPSVNEEPSGTAADFTAYDAAGNTVKLSDFLGKPVVVNFWASWCPPCKSELPSFERQYQKYGDQVVFLMVDLTDGQRETTESGKAYAADQGYSFPLLFDSDLSAVQAYGITSIPRTMFIDAGGTILSAHEGILEESELQSEIEVLLNPSK